MKTVHQQYIFYTLYAQFMPTYKYSLIENVSCAYFPTVQNCYLQVENLKTKGELDQVFLANISLMGLPKKAANNGLLS